VAAFGDSGGPVYSYRSDGRVDARGTISNADNGFGATCPGSYPDRGTSQVYYAPLLRPQGSLAGSLQLYGVNVLTE
jgi:hypothetical protein